MRFTISFAFLIFITITTPTRSYTAEEDNYLMISNRGAKWVYTVKQEFQATTSRLGQQSKVTKQESGTLTITNEGEKDFDGLKAILFVSNSQFGFGSYARNSYYRYSPEGIILVGSEFIQASKPPRRTKHDPPLLYIKNPLVTGTTWRTGKSTKSVVGQERVKVPAGEFDAVKLVTDGDAGTTTTEWWVRGVGLVKRFQPRPLMEAELINYSMPGEATVIAKGQTSQKEATQSTDARAGARFTMETCSKMATAVQFRRVRGDVPPSFDLASQPNVNEILNQAREFSLRECGRPGGRFEIHIYQDNKLALTAGFSWGGDFDILKNIPLEQRLLATGELRTLGNNHFLFFIGMDPGTSTKFWLYSQERSKKCWTWSGGIQYVYGEVPKTVSLLNEDAARSLVMRGEQAAVNSCGRPWDSRRIHLVPVGYNAIVRGSNMDFNPLLVEAGVFRNYNGREPPTITHYANFAVEAERRRIDQRVSAEREVARLRRWSEFAQKYGVQEMIDAGALQVNPFVYEGKTVAIRTHFERMLSPDTGKFGDVIVSGLPRDLFRSRSDVVLAGRVLGTQESKPHLKFVGVHVCQDYMCSDLLAQR